MEVLHSRRKPSSVQIKQHYTEEQKSLDDLYSSNGKKKDNSGIVLTKWCGGIAD